MRYLSFEPTASSAACSRRDKLAAAARATVPLVTLRRAERRDKVFFMAPKLHPGDQRAQLEKSDYPLVGTCKSQAVQLTSFDPAPSFRLQAARKVQCGLEDLERNTIS